MGGWVIFLTVTFTSGGSVTLGYNSMETCQEMRAHYQQQADVAHVSACTGER